MRPAYTAILTAALALAGCTVGPDYTLPKQALIQAPGANVAFASSASVAFKQDAPPDDWWRL